MQNTEWSGIMKYTTGRWYTYAADRTKVFVTATDRHDAHTKLSEQFGKVRTYSPEIDTRGIKAPAGPTALVKHYALSPAARDALQYAGLGFDVDSMANGNVINGLVRKGLLEALGNRKYKVTPAGARLLDALS